jgi:serine/threonine protein kinase
MSATPILDDMTDETQQLDEEDTEMDIEEERKQREEREKAYKRFVAEQEEKKKKEIQERIKRVREQKDKQYKEEEYLIEQLTKSGCKKEDFSKIVKMIQLSMSKTNGLLPVELLHILSCYFNIDIKYVDQINESITDIKELSSGAQGIVYTASFNKIADAIVIKSPKSNNLNDEVFHEYFVGVMATNRMRSRVPNFVWTYGYVRCLPIDTSGKGKGNKKWCKKEEKNNVNFIIYERIDGSNLSSAIKSGLDVRYFISYLLQLMPSLEFASKIFGFTHYDLHAMNVLLRNVKYDFVYIKYEKFYVKTNKIATMIDFGRATIRVIVDTTSGTSSKYYGIPGFERFNHHSDKTNPMYDMFKLIGSSMLIAKGNNTDIYNFCLLILKDFYKMNDNDILNQISIRWSYPGNDELGKLFNYIVSNDKLTNIIKELLFLDVDDKKRILCTDELCLTKL